MVDVSTLPKTLTSEQPQVPTKLRINGHEIPLPDGGTKLPLPGFPDHSLDLLQIAPGVILSTWFDAEGSITHRKLVHGASPYRQTAQKQEVLRILTDVDGDVPYQIEPHAALAWTNYGWLHSLEQDGAGQDPAHAWLDKLCRARIAADQTDPDQTKSTGSGNKEFFHPVTSMPDGMNYWSYLYLDAYWRKAVRRRRNWIDPQTGFPFALGRDEAVVKVVADPLDVVFGTWDTNLYGLNPWDEDHLDGDEIHRAFKATKHPAYFQDLLQLYYDVRWLGDYVGCREADPKRKVLSCGGAPRKLGWWIGYLAQVLDAILDVVEANLKQTGAISPLYVTLLDDLASDIYFALESSARDRKEPYGFPYSISGSVPPSMKDLTNPLKPTVPHVVTYQFPVVLHGVARLLPVLRRASSVIEAKGPSGVDWNLYSSMCRDEVISWNSLCLDNVRSDLDADLFGVRSYVRLDGTAEEWQGATGTAFWHVAAFLQAEVADPGSFPFPAKAQFLLDEVLKLGGTWNWAKWSFAAPRLGGKDSI